MLFRTTLPFVLAFCLLTGFAAAAKTRSSAGKKTAARTAAASKKKAASSTSARAGVRRSSAASSKSSSKKVASSKRRRGKTTAARSRASGPPRQTQPTPERYMEIQGALASKGYYEGPVDGNWGADCVAALKRFQADQNLQPDGKLGALSLIALGLGPKRDTQAQFLAKPDSQAAEPQ